MLNHYLAVEVAVVYFQGLLSARPQITAEREPLADVNSTDNEVKVVLEMPGIRKRRYKNKCF